MIELNAAFAGFCASLASVFSKLAFEDDTKTLKFLIPNYVNDNSECSIYSYAILNFITNPLHGDQYCIPSFSDNKRMLSSADVGKQYLNVGPLHTIPPQPLFNSRSSSY